MLFNKKHRNHKLAVILVGVVILAALVLKNKNLTQSQRAKARAYPVGLGTEYYLGPGLTIGAGKELYWTEERYLPGQFRELLKLNAPPNAAQQAATQIESLQINNNNLTNTNNIIEEQPKPVATVNEDNNAAILADYYASRGYPTDLYPTGPIDTRAPPTDVATHIIPTWTNPFDPNFFPNFDPKYLPQYNQTIPVPNVEQIKQLAREAAAQKFGGATTLAEALANLQSIYPQINLAPLVQDPSFKAQAIRELAAQYSGPTDEFGNPIAGEYIPPCYPEEDAASCAARDPFITESRPDTFYNRVMPGMMPESWINAYGNIQPDDPNTGRYCNELWEHPETGEMLCNWDIGALTPDQQAQSKRDRLLAMGYKPVVVQSWEDPYWQPLVEEKRRRETANIIQNLNLGAAETMLRRQAQLESMGTDLGGYSYDLTEYYNIPELNTIAFGGTTGYNFTSDAQGNTIMTGPQSDWNRPQSLIPYAPEFTAAMLPGGTLDYSQYYSAPITIQDLIGPEQRMLIEAYGGVENWLYNLQHAETITEAMSQVIIRQREADNAARSACYAEVMAQYPDPENYPTGIFDRCRAIGRSL